MITYAQQNSEEQTDAPPQAVDDHIAPAPRVSVQAFCETVETAAAVQSAGEDRRLAKAHLKIQMGGMAAAIEAYRSAPTPNVIILETEGRGLRIFGFSPGTIDTDMQVKIRASGLNQVSQIPRANLSPVEHAVRGLLYLCDAAADDLIGEDASMRDEAFRKRIGLG